MAFAIREITTQARHSTHNHARSLVFCRVLYVVTCLMWSSSAARTLPREPRHNQTQSNAIKAQYNTAIKPRSSPDQASTPTASLSYSTASTCRSGSWTTRT